MAEDVTLRLLGDVSDLTRKLSKAKGGLKGLSDSMFNVGKKAAIAFAGLGAATIGVVGQFAGFEKQMSKVKALSGATGDDFLAMSQKARELGKTTAFSAKEAGQGMEYMALAGYSATQTIAAMPGVLNLAAAAQMDLGTASDIVTDSLTAFGLEAKDATHFADIMAKASATSNTSVQQLGEAFKYAAPVARAFGLSAEETSAALAVMANSGIKSSMAGTTLRMSLSRLAKPTAAVKKALDKYNISVTDSAGNMLPFNNIMDQSRKAMENMTQQQKLAFVTQVFGQRSISGMTAILNTSTEEFGKYTDSLIESDGASKKMADTMLDNVAGALTILKSALQEAAISIGETIAPAIRGLVKVINFLVNAFNATPKVFKLFIGTLLLVATAVAGAVMVFGFLGGAVLRGILVFQQSLPHLLKFKTSLINTSKSVLNFAKTFTKGAFTRIVAVFKNLSNAFTLTALKAKILVFWNKLLSISFKKMGLSMLGTIKSMALFTFELIKNAAKSAFSAMVNFTMLIPSIIGTAIAIISSAIPAMLGLIAATGGLILLIPLIIGGFLLLKNVLKALISFVKAFVGGFIGELIKQFKDMGNIISSTFKESFDAVKKAFAPLLKLFSKGKNEAQLLKKGFQLLGRIIAFALVAPLKIVAFLISAYIRLVAKLILWVVKLSKAFIKWVFGLNGVKKAFLAIKNIIGSIIKSIKRFIDSIKKIKSAVGKFFRGAQKEAEKGGVPVKGGAPVKGKGRVTPSNEDTDASVNNLQTIKDKAKELEEAFLSIAQSFTQNMVQGIMEGTFVLSEYFEQFTRSIAEKFLINLFNPITEGMQELGLAMYDILNETIGEILSPMMNFFKIILQGFANVIKGITNIFLKSPVGKAVIGFISSLLDPIKLGQIAILAVAKVATIAWALIQAIPTFGASLAAIPVAMGEFATGAASIMAIKFQAGTPGLEEDMLAQIGKGEIVVPETFSEGIKSGELALTGSEAGGVAGAAEATKVDVEISMKDEAFDFFEAQAIQRGRLGGSAIATT